uniref:Lymphocyte antigen 6E-like n=1 Tax=Schistosoma mansoni TaxID=6183 RepID=A0A5K4F8I4_SCHMA
MTTLSLMVRIDNF